MSRIRLFSALLLAVPLIGSTFNHLFKWVQPPLDDGSNGARMWALIRDDGLMDWLAAGHLAIGLMLLLPRTRFAAAMLQLPITIGIVAPLGLWRSTSPCSPMGCPWPSAC